MAERGTPQRPSEDVHAHRHTPRFSREVDCPWRSRREVQTFAVEDESDRLGSVGREFRIHHVAAAFSAGAVLQRRATRDVEGSRPVGPRQRRRASGLLLLRLPALLDRRDWSRSTPAFGSRRTSHHHGPGPWRASAGVLRARTLSSRLASRGGTAHRHAAGRAERHAPSRSPGILLKVETRSHARAYERSLAIASCPRLVAHARGVAHSGSSGRLFGAPDRSRNLTISS
jgi:hypothetical protein